MFISFEGIEGSGKSSLIKNLKDHFEELSIDAIFTKEPGGTELGKEIRKLLLNPFSTISSKAELFLLMADRVEHVKKFIEPNLKKNKIIFCDRYIDSTVAYQGSGREIKKTKIEELIKIFNLPLPDFTILLDLPVSEGLKRAKNRNKLDRFEKEDMYFHENIRQSYLSLHKDNGDRIILFDSSVTEKELFKNVLNFIENKLNESY